jgi:hypothetical protein
VWADLAPWVTQGGAAGILGAIVFGIYSGRLVPRRVVDDIRTDRDARIAEAHAQTQEWRAAYQAAEESRRHLAGQVDTALVTMQAVTRIVGPATTEA